MLIRIVYLQNIVINGIYWNLVPKNRNFKNSSGSVSMKSINAANINSKTCINPLSCIFIYFGLLLPIPSLVGIPLELCIVIGGKNAKRSL
jgi:hypothetical protein